MLLLYLNFHVTRPMQCNTPFMKRADGSQCIFTVIAIPGKGAADNKNTFLLHVTLYEQITPSFTLSLELSALSCFAPLGINAQREKMCAA